MLRPAELPGGDDCTWEEQASAASTGPWTEPRPPRPSGPTPRMPVCVVRRPDLRGRVHENPSENRVIRCETEGIEGVALRPRWSAWSDQTKKLGKENR